MILIEMKCCQGKLRLWPACSAKFRCISGPGRCVSSSSGARLRSDGVARYTCYPCDYNLCQGCVSRQDKLLACLQNLCDKVRLGERRERFQLNFKRKSS